MLARVCSAAVNGIDAYAIEVEVNCGYGETFIAIISYILRMRQRFEIKHLAEAAFARRNFIAGDDLRLRCKNPGCF